MILSVAAVNERLVAATHIQQRRESRDDPSPRAIRHPALKSAMTSLVRRVVRREGAPGSPCSKDPDDTVEHLPRRFPRSATPIAACSWYRNQRFVRCPLPVGEFHPEQRSETARSLDRSSPCPTSTSTSTSTSTITITRTGFVRRALD